MYVCMYVCMYCMYVFLYMYVCMYVCMEREMLTNLSEGARQSGRYMSAHPGRMV